MTMEDLPIYRRMMTDPLVMAELGGPLAEEGLREKWQGIVDSVRDGSVWYLAIVPNADSDETAGTVCVWEHEWRGDQINEIGWMVVPEQQGRGLASGAVRSVLDRARAENRWGRPAHRIPAGRGRRTSGNGGESEGESARCRASARSVAGERRAHPLRGRRPVLCASTARPAIPPGRGPTRPAPGR